MKALDIWFECRALSVTLTVDGDRLSYRGPPAAVERIVPILKKHKPELLTCVSALAGLPVEDGAFSPWGPYLTPTALKNWQRELFDVVDALAKLERWPDDTYDLVIGAIDRQPISTLRPDLAHFTERLAAARHQANSPARGF